jgi:hypothetical protein
MPGDYAKPRGVRWGAATLSDSSPRRAPPKGSAAKKNRRGMIDFCSRLRMNNIEAV